jgi:hypothetical protein
MIASHPFPCDRGPLWSARLGHEADATARGTGSPMSLPGMVLPAVSAATPPRPDEEMPPLLPARAKAALTFLHSRAVFRVRAEGRDLHLRFLSGAHRIIVVEARG